jgi:hypothetical protein
MTLDLLLALGILLSTASQLRPAGASIGPGEVCLAIWIALMLGRETVQLGPRFTPALSRLVIFWLLFAVAQSIGTLAGFAIGDVHDSSLFMHDVMAYPLLATTSMLSVVGPDAGSRLHRVGWLLVTLGSAILALQVAQVWGLISMGSIDPWYWDRVRGWSENPNQLAILCAVLGLLSLHLADVAASAARDQRIDGAVVGILCGFEPSLSQLKRIVGYPPPIRVLRLISRRTSANLVQISNIRHPFSNCFAVFYIKLFLIGQIAKNAPQLRRTYLVGCTTPLPHIAKPVNSGQRVLSEQVVQDHSSFGGINTRLTDAIAERFQHSAIG